METAAKKFPRVVIVGAGFAGMSAAKALARAPVEIVLIDRHNYHLFQPLLYQVATAALSPAQIAQPIREIFKRQKNCGVALGEVTSIDTANRLVKGHKGELSYDYLILATGATHAYFGHDEWRPYAPGLKSIEDATEIRRRILEAFEKAEISEDPKEQEALLTFVIVGAGPTGVEMAGAIAELARDTLRHNFRRIDPSRARIILAEAGSRVLATFPESLSDHALSILKGLGVEVLLGTPVTECNANGVTIAGNVIPARTIIWAAGVQASPITKWLSDSLDRAGRILVNPDLSVPDHENVFAIGDTASLRDTNGIPVPGLAPAAEQQGKYVANLIKHRLVNKPYPSSFLYNDMGTMATIGRGQAIADIKGLRFAGFFAWLLWGVIHLLPLVGFRNRFVVALDWLGSYLSRSRGVRLITVAKATEDI